jgi:hypothetical protein
MSRRLTLTALALALAGTGCLDNKSSIEILGHAFPDGVDTCVFKPTGDYQLGNGQLNLNYAGAAKTYDMVVYIKNTMPDPTSTGTGITLSGKSWRASAVRVRYNPSDYTSKFPPTASLMVNFQGEVRMPVDGLTVEPNTSQSQFIHVIPQSVGTALAAAMGAGTTGELVVGITIEGITLDGVRVDTGEWYFGIDVANPAAPVTITCADPAKVLNSCFGFQQDPIKCI